MLDRCASTHVALKQGVDRRFERDGKLPQSLLVLTEEQREGKGRRRPDWWSGPRSCNVAVSLMLPTPPQPPETVGLHAACAVADALMPLLAQPSELALKWPNDILLGGAKIGGVLAEVSDRAGEGFALIGLGVNLLAAPPADVAPYPTAAVGGLDRTAFVAAWLWALEKRLIGARRNGHQQLEQDFLHYLRRWAPNGVLDPATGHRGPLVEFSVQRGLTWGQKGDFLTHPLGWIPSLEALLSKES